MAIVLDVKKLGKTYKQRSGFLWRKVTYTPALVDATFKVRAGEIFGFLGPNGAGKTTTVNIIAGILTKDSGSVKIFGEEPSEETRNRMNVATAYTHLNHELSVYQNLNVFAHMYNVNNKKEKIMELLKRFGIEKLKDSRFYRLSSGQKTRVALCKGLINNPEFLMLDEATVGLDPDIAQHVREDIKHIGATILFTSHNMKEIEQLCTRTAFLHNGKVLKVGTVKQLTRLVKEQIVSIDFYPKKGLGKILQKLEDVEIIEHQMSRIVLKVRHADKKLHDVLHPLLHSGMVIKDMHIDKPSLEDVFINIARGKI